MDQPTVNENPTVLSVDTRRKVQQLEAFASSAASSVADLAVRHALTEVSIATEGKGLSLLNNLGAKFPETPESIPFVYAPKRWVTPTNQKEGSTSESLSKVDEKEEQKEKETINSLEDGGINSDEVFEIIRNIQDPEHPLTLEHLGVVSRGQIVVDKHSGHRKRVEVRFTPTIPHCSMATQIGLCLRVKLDRSLPSAFKTTIKIEPGTHASENAINKQLADKERVCAALENKHLLGIVNRCIVNGMTGNMS
jgi:metal-sulfur cluster biosynthetic enzyme